MTRHFSIFVLSHLGKVFTALALAFCISLPNAALAGDTRVMGQLSFALGSDDIRFSIRTETDAFGSLPGSFGEPSRPIAELTASFTGPDGKFKSLSFNRMPIMLDDLTLYAASEDDSGFPWGYAAIGVGAAAALILLVRATVVEDSVDAIRKAGPN